MTCIADTASINLTVAAGQLTADLVIDPGAGLAPNPLVVNPAGVYVIGADGWIPLPSTLAFSSADGHMFVATSSADLRSFIGPGDKIRLVQTGVPAYFVVHAITATQIWLYGGQLYTLAATAITLPYFSKVKSPIGFTLDPTNWTEQAKDTSTRTQSTPGSGTWYNPGSITLAIPIGVWNVEYEAAVEGGRNASTVNIESTLSTANNSESDPDFTSYYGFATSTALVDGTFSSTGLRRKTIALLVKTSYFANVRLPFASGTSISLNGAYSPTIIRAICAYL